MTRPIPGLVIGGIIGVVGLWWAVEESLRRPSVAELAAEGIFPGFAAARLAGTGASMLMNTALLSGVGITGMSHPSGPRIVRITCVVAALLTIALFGIIYFVSVRPQLHTLDAVTRGGVEGGLIGGTIGGLLQWALVYALFMRRRTGGF